MPFKLSLAIILIISMEHATGKCNSANLLSSTHEIWKVEFLKDWNFSRAANALILICDTFAGLLYGREKSSDLEVTSSTSTTAPPDSLTVTFAIGPKRYLIVKKDVSISPVLVFFCCTFNSEYTDLAMRRLRRNEF